MVSNVQLAHTISHCELKAKSDCPHVQTVRFGDVRPACEKPTCTLHPPGGSLALHLSLPRVINGFINTPV